MVLVEDKYYQETLQILRGKKALLPIYTELKAWLRERFGITAYNFIFEEIKYNNPEHRYQLYILLSSTRDYQRMEAYDPKKQKEIATKFSELAVKFNYGEARHCNNVWVCYNDFSVEIQTDANRRTGDKINGYLKEKYKAYSLWDICSVFTSVVVFFHTDEDIRRNKENGVNDAMKAEYFEALKQYDEFDMYNKMNFTMSFDSKENLDRNYEGNLYYYFK